MTDTDISGITFTVTAGAGGGSKLQLSEDEWYPATLTKIEKIELPNQQYGPSLSWTFELQGPEFTYTYEGVTKQTSVRGNTSLIFSSNPARPSKLYTWYCKLTSKVPEEGAKVTLGTLIGMQVAVMVKGSQGKDKRGEPTTWFNVDKVKPLGAASESKAPAAKAQAAPAAKAAVKPVAQVEPHPQVAPSKNPGGITDPSEISSDIIGTSTKESKTTEAADLYKDVF